MSEPRDGDIGGDLPPLDSDLAAWLASDPSPAMPAEVWTGIEARLAAEPALGSGEAGPPAGVVDLGAERSRRRSRALPVLAGAAGIALVGVIVVPILQNSSPPVVADGGTTSNPVVASDAAPLAAAPEAASMPRAMVATGTDYTSQTTPIQVASLLASAGMADTRSVESAMTAAPTLSAMPGVGLASSPEALAACLERLGLPPQSVPLVVDAATVEGRAGSAIVTIDERSPAQPLTLHVVAVGQDCTEEDAAAALHWDIPLVP